MRTIALELGVCYSNTSAVALATSGICINWYNGDDSSKHKASVSAYTVGSSFAASDITDASAGCVAKWTAAAGTSKAALDA